MGLELLSTRVPKKYAVTELQTPYHGDAYYRAHRPCVFVLVVFLVSDKTSMCDEESCVLVFVVNPSQGGSRRWSIARQGGGKTRLLVTCVLVTRTRNWVLPSP